jgi:acetate kinase
MKVLVVNAGSSSLKSQLIETDGKLCLMKALGERLGGPDARLKVTMGDAAVATARTDVAGKGADEVLDIVLDELASDPASPLLSKEQSAQSGLAGIDAVGFRVVSGGEYFTKTVLIDDDALAKIEACSALAPLHNPAAVACMRLCRNRLPSAPQAAVFDTAFHQTMPPKAYMYPLPMRYYTEYGIRRYGAHGTSHRYAAQQAANLLGRPLQDLGIISCHLGNGGSITAVDHGRSVDTTMGFTPLEGIMMGTRSGSIDPAIVTYVMRREHITYDQMDHVLNCESGLLGISGRSGDMREILAAADEGDENSALAVDMYVYAVQKAIGAYYAVMTRTDAVVMTAGIGENSAELRRMVFDRLAHMGMILDPERNKVVGAVGTDRIVSIDDSPIKICVVTTDEELRIARETAAVVSGEK